MNWFRRAGLIWWIMEEEDTRSNYLKTLLHWNLFLLWESLITFWSWWRSLGSWMFIMVCLCDDLLLILNQLLFIYDWHGLILTETGQEEVVEFLLSIREDELIKERGVNMSLLSQEPVKPLLDLMIFHDQEFSISPNAQILFSSGRSELNDMVSIAAKLKKSARWKKLSRLVPQSQR